MVAILFICLVNNKNNAFLYYYKMLNLWQSGFNYLKDEQIKTYCKIFKSKPCRPILWVKSESLFSCYIAEIGSNHYRADHKVVISFLVVWLSLSGRGHFTDIPWGCRDMYWLSSTSCSPAHNTQQWGWHSTYRYVSAIPSSMGTVVTNDWCIISHLPTRIRAGLMAGLWPYKCPDIAKREKSISPLYAAGTVVKNDTLKI